MDIYPEYFVTTINAHFIATLIPLYRLYESKADTFNIPELLNRLSRDGRLADRVHSDVDSLLKQSLPIWKKVGVLRNRAFGHRSRAHTIAQLFQIAQITPNELGELVELTKRILNTLSQGVQLDEHSLDLEVRNDVLRMLNNLRAFHEQGD